MYLNRKGFFSNLVCDKWKLKIDPMKLLSVLVSFNEYVYIVVAFKNMNFFLEILLEIIRQGLR